jgi:uncharacterized protein
LAARDDVIAKVQSGDLGSIRRLLEQDPGLAQAKDANGVSALMHAFYYRRQEIADLLLRTKSELDVFEAAAAGKTDQVKQILAKDRDAPRRWSGDGFTALHLAAFFDHPEAARILIAHGAQVSAAAENAMQVTPLHSAAAAHSGEMVRMLVENGAEVNARQQGGWTALHEAAQIGDVEMVKTLLQHGADPQIRSDDGRTSVDMARAKGHEQIAKLLAG